MPDGEDVLTPGAAHDAEADVRSGEDARVASSLLGAKGAEWADELSDRVIDGVDWVKDRTTLRALTALRAVVYGLVVLVAAVTALLFLVIGLVRLWDVYLPLGPVGRRVWLGYVVLGGLLSLAGAWLLLRGHAKSREQE
jgi:hypothetical protein